MAYTAEGGLEVWDFTKSSFSLLITQSDFPPDSDQGEISYIPFDWSPDNQWIIITKTWPDYSKYWILNITTKQILKVTSDPQQVVWISNTKMIAAVNYDNVAQTGIEAGIYLLEVKDGELSERRIYYRPINPKNGEIGRWEYRIKGIDTANSRINISQYTELDGGRPVYIEWWITIEGTPLGAISTLGDCYTLEGPSVLPDGRLLCIAQQQIYAFDTQTVYREVIYKWLNNARVSDLEPRLLIMLLY